MCESGLPAGEYEDGWSLVWRRAGALAGARSRARGVEVSGGGTRSLLRDLYWQWGL